MIPLPISYSFETANMGDCAKQVSADDASLSVAEVATSFELANRASHNYVHMRQWEAFEKSLADPWTPDRLDGVQVMSG